MSKHLLSNVKAENSYDYKQLQAEAKNEVAYENNVYIILMLDLLLKNKNLENKFDYNKKNNFKKSKNVLKRKLFMSIYNFQAILQV